MIRATFATGALLAALTLSQQSSANQLFNGSFENPVLTSPPYQFDIPFSGHGQSIPHWTVTVGSVDLTNGCCGSFAPPAPGTGNQYIDLVGSLSQGAISQTFSTVADQTYDLSFYYSRNYSVTPFGASALITLMGNAPLVLQGGSTVTHQDSSFSNPTSFNNMNWAIFSALFIADSASTTLTFTHTFGAFNGGIFLDHVSVDPVADAVPVPAALPLFASILGAGGIVGWFRRRRKHQA